MDERDRVVLVTGSTSGIGRAAALAFARDGSTVIVNGRHQERADEVAAQLATESANARVRGIGADLTASTEVDRLVRLHPRVDVLVNNAGVFGAQPVFEVPDEVWLRYFDVNVLSGVRLARAYAPGMRARGWGRIVFVSSDSAVFTPTEMVHYAATKTAQLTVARGMAQELAGTGVTVNSILPGPTLTPGVREFIEAGFGGSGEPFEEAAARFVARELPTSLVQRLLEPEEVAALIHYVGSTASSATSGASLRADGGVAPTIIP